MVHLRVLVGYFRVHRCYPARWPAICRQRYTPNVPPLFVTRLTEYWHFRIHDFQWFHKCSFRHWHIHIFEYDHSSFPFFVTRLTKYYDFRIHDFQWFHKCTYFQWNMNTFGNDGGVSGLSLTVFFTRLTKYQQLLECQHLVRLNDPVFCHTSNKILRFSNSWFPIIPYIQFPPLKYTHFCAASGVYPSFLSHV